MRRALLSLALLASTGCSLMIDPDGVEPPRLVESLAVAPATAILPKGTVQQLTATATYSDGSTGDVTASVTWTSSVPASVTVSNAAGTKGRATASGASGTATITAALDGKSATASLMATAPAVTAIAVTPATATLPKGATQQLTATATFTDTTTSDVTDQAIWVSDAATVVAVSSAPGTRGLATAEGTSGAAAITATFGGQSGTATLTAGPVALSSLAVTPSLATLFASGTALQLTATANWSDGTATDVTAVATWTGGTVGVATVSDAAGTKGLVTPGATPGSVTLTATFGGRSDTASIGVTAATVTSIAIAPGTATVAKGATRQLVATATYSNAMTANVTEQATWTTSAALVATVSDADGTKGLARAVGTSGNAIITASFGGQSGTATLTAAPAAVVSVAVTPAAPTLVRNTTLQLTATATYTDGTTADVTSSATWATNDAAVATVSAGGLATAVGDTGTAILSASFGGQSGSASVSATTATVTSIAVVPAAATLPKGTTQPLAAIATYNDLSTADVTSQATWSSSATGAATVSNLLATKGVVTATGASGTATITAAFGGQSGTAVVTAAPAAVVSIAVTPATPTVPKGATQQLTATATYTDATTANVTATATWTSGTPAAATVSDATGTKGLVTGVGTSGTATITASVGGQSGTAVVTAAPAAVVSIAVTPATATLPKGATQQLTATATYTDATTANVTASATWTSSAPAVATVSDAAGSKGLVTAVGSASSATLTAAFGGQSGTATVTASPAEVVSIAVSPGTATLPQLGEVQLTATATWTDSTTSDVTSSATWSTADALVATVSDVVATKGLVTGQGAGGPVTITAAYGGQSGTAAISVTAATVTLIAISPATATVPKGATQQLTATATYDDLSTGDVTGQASWSSDAPTVATVSNAAGTKGRVTGVGTSGTANVTASFGGQSGLAIVTAAPAAVSSVAVTPATATVPKGATQQLTATATYTDATTADVTATATWTSGTPAAATVSDAAGTKGLVIGVGTSGTTTVTAAFDGKSGAAVITAAPAAIVSIAVTPATATVAKGATRQLTATATYTDATTADVTATATWTSSAPAVATVSDAAGTKGLVTGVGTSSTTTITAALGGKSGTAVITAAPAAVVSIAIEAAVTTLSVGETTNLLARATYTDATTADVTATANWTSSAPGVASVSTTNPTKGRVTAVSPSATPAVITATVGAVSGTVSITITPAEVSFITITPASPVTAVGGTIQLHATATYTDGSSIEVTGNALAAWSGGGAVATVSDVGASKGVVTGVAAGTATISAAFGGQVGSILVTVRSVASIAVTGYATPVPAGQTLQLTATATLNGGGTQDVTTSATWASANPSVATVSTTGLVTAVATTGSSSISATLGVSGSQTVTVTGPVLVSIAVTGSATPIPDGTTVQLTATGTYSNATTANVTATANWSSLSPSVATVSNTAPSKGLVLAEATTGTAAIQANVGGIIGELTVSVTDPNLVSIAVTGVATPIPAGTTVQLVATGTYSNATTATLTSSATWTSLSPAVATVDDGAAKGAVTAVATSGTARIQATVGAITGELTVSATNPNLVSIAVTGYATPIPAGTTIQLAAIGTFSNATTADLSASAIWTSLSPAVATVSQTPAGEVTAVATTGTARIQATVGAVTGEVTVSVTGPVLVSIAVTDPMVPATAIPNGLTRQLVAMGTYSNSTTTPVTIAATWTSDTTSVATVDDSLNKGLVTAVAASGTSVIRARVGAVEGSLTVQVTAAQLLSITIEQFPASPAVGIHQQLVARGSYTDGTTPDLSSVVNWWTTNGTVATVGMGVADRGLFRALAEGPVTVVASYDGVDGTVATFVGPVAPVRLDVSVKALEERAPPFPVDTLALAPYPYQANARVTYSDGRSVDASYAATWISSDPGVAQVSNLAGERGLVTAVSPGPVTLTASFEGISGSFATSVTAPVVIFIVPLPSYQQTTLPAGTTVQYKAMALQSDWSLIDISTSAAWTTSDPGVATVQNGASGGVVTTVGAGSALITISHAGLTGSTSVLVTPAMLVDFRIWPWPSAAPRVYYPWGDRLLAIAYYSDGSVVDVSAGATWFSSDETVATIDWEGQVNPLRMAPFAATAMYQGWVVGPVPVDIVPGGWVEISYPPPIPVGQKLQLKASMWQNDQQVDVTDQMTWVSDMPAYADFMPGDPPGMITAFAPSWVTIRASAGGQSYGQSFDVTSANPTSISVSPNPVAAPLGGTGRLTATLYYDNGMNADVSRFADWFSDAPSVVSASTTDRGAVTALLVGGAFVRANLWGQQGATWVNVYGSPVQTIWITPAPTAQVGVGGRINLTASAMLQDFTGIDITAFAKWQAPRNSNVVWLDPNQPGAVQGNTEGSVLVAASFGDAVATTTVEVGGGGVLQLNSIEGPMGTFYSGSAAKFRAWGYLTNWVWADVSEYVTWETTTPWLISVSNVPGERGLVTGLGSPVSEQAHLRAFIPGGQVLDYYFWVEYGNLVGPIWIEPVPLIVTLGGTWQLAAYANVTPCGFPPCRADVTSIATWWSEDPMRVRVGNTAADKGQVTGMMAYSGAYVYADAPPFGFTAAWVDVQPPMVNWFFIRELEPWMSGSPCDYGMGVSGYYPTGADAAFAACVEFNNGWRYDVTEQANWWTDLPGVGTVSDAPGTKGWLTTNGPGNLLLQASHPGYGSNSVNLMVSSAMLDHIGFNSSVTFAHAGARPSDMMMGGDMGGVGIVARYSDGSERAIGQYASIVSSNPAVVEIGGMTQQGDLLLDAHAPGVATLDAYYRGLHTAMTVNVDGSPYQGSFIGADTLLALIGGGGGGGGTEFTVPATIPVGYQLSLPLFATDRLGFPWDATEQATWSSSNPGALVVSDLPGSKGVVTGVAPGYAVISATVDGITATRELGVNDAWLQDVTFSPPFGVAPVGLTVGPFQAIANYSDGSSFDVTSLASWAGSGCATPGVTPGTYTIVCPSPSTATVFYDGVPWSLLLTGF